MTDEPLPPPLPHLFTLKRDRLAGLLGLVWAVLIALLYGSGLFDHFEDQVRDWEQVLLPASAGSGDFALISIDRVPSDRPWPWPRLDYAILLRALAQDVPQSVVFEIGMHDRNPHLEAFDESFARQAARLDRVVFSASALQIGNAQGGTQPGPALRVRGKDLKLPRFLSVWGPVETFSAQSPVGIANFSCGPDQTLRRLPLVFLVGDKVLPSLALTAAAVRLGADLRQSELEPGQAILLRDGGGRLLRRIPVDDDGRLLIRWRRPGAAPLRIGYDDFLVYADEAERGVPAHVDLRQLARRQVWVGVADPAVMPPRATAVGKRPPVEIAMAATTQITQGDFLVPMPRGAAIFLFLMTGGLLAYAMELLPPSAALAALLSLGVMLAIVGLAAFFCAGVCFPLASLGLLLGGTFVGSRAARLWEVDPPAPRPDVNGEIQEG